MEILSYMGTVMDLNQWMVLAMFLTFIIVLFRGIPVVYALVGVSLIFVLVGEIVLDSRPSDALAIALRTLTPIYVSDEVMEDRLQRFMSVQARISA